MPKKTSAKQKTTNNGKHPGGRPTKYDPLYCKEIIKYFSVEPFEEKVVATVTGKNDFQREEIKEIANPLRFISGFARSIGVTHECLCEWSRKHPEFSDALKEAKELQKEMMITNGTKGLYNASFTIFAMKNMFGWRDSQEDKQDQNALRYDNIMQEIRALREERAKKQKAAALPERANRFAAFGVPN